MFSKNSALKILTIGVFLCEIPAIFAWSNGKYTTLPLFVWWCMYAFMLFSFYKLSPKNFKVLPISLWVLLLLFSVMYGLVAQTENYWDYKALIVNFWIFSVPISVYAYSNPNVLKNVLKFWFKYSWILIIFLLPLVDSSWYGRLLVPYCFLSLFYSILPIKLKIWVIGVILFLISFSIGARTDILRFSFALLLGIIVSQRFFLKRSRVIIKSLIITFFVSPIILFILAVTNVFNVFNIQQELDFKDISTSTTEGREENLMSDTRTFIYAECITSAMEHNYVLCGRSIARGYDTHFFAGTDDNLAKAGRGGERLSSEVAIMNIFTYFGLIGCVLYFVIFLIATYKAVYCSNNNYLPILGVYVAFKWLLSWIEEYTMYELNLLILWMMIAMCFSPWFRNMTDKDFELWVKSLFKKNNKHETNCNNYNRI